MLKTIKHIQAKNYRTYEEMSIELSPGINIFRGGNDQGKSNIVWMLTDVLFNTTGDDFITVGKKETEVTVDGLVWKKSKTKNEYVIPGHPEPFIKVGSESPQEVKDFTGFDYLKLGGKATDRCLNISHQLKNHFVINDSAADNALLLGSLSKIEQIYRGVKNCNADLGKLKREQKETDNNYKALKTQYAEYSWVTEFGDRVQEVKDRYAELKKKEQGIQELETAIQKLRKLLKTKKQQTARLEKLSDVNIRQIRGFDARMSVITALGKDIADLRGYFKRRDGIKGKLLYIIKGIEQKRSEIRKLLDTGVCPITEEPLPAECRKKAIKLI